MTLLITSTDPPEMPLPLASIEKMSPALSTVARVSPLMPVAPPEMLPVALLITSTDSPKMPFPFAPAEMPASIVVSRDTSYGCRKSRPRCRQHCRHSRMYPSMPVAARPPGCCRCCPLHGGRRSEAIATLRDAGAGVDHIYGFRDDAVPIRFRREDAASIVDSREGKHPDASCPT